MSEILRTIFKKEIITEFLPPEKKSNKIIIFGAFLLVNTVFGIFRVNFSK